MLTLIVSIVAALFIFELLMALLGSSIDRNF